MADVAARPVRLLPHLAEPDTAPFWQVTREGRLTYQVCRRCGSVVSYPRAHCTGCRSLELEWRTSAGEGAIYSFTVIRQHGHPFLRSTRALRAGADRPQRGGASSSRI